MRSFIWKTWTRLYLVKVYNFTSIIFPLKQIYLTKLKWLRYTGEGLIKIVICSSYFYLVGQVEGRGVYRVLLGKPERRISLGRPRRRWVDIRMDLQELECGYMDWIGLAQDRDNWRTLVSAGMNVRVPWNAENFLNSCKPFRFSRKTLHHGVSK